MQRTETKVDVTLSAHHSWLDWQVIPKDKLHFDLVFTHHNKTQGEDSTNAPIHHIQVLLPLVSWYHHCSFR